VDLEARLTRLERAVAPAWPAGEEEGDFFVARELAGGPKPVADLRRAAKAEPWYSQFAWADVMTRLVEQGSVRVAGGTARLIDAELLARAKDWTPHSVLSVIVRR